MHWISRAVATAALLGLCAGATNANPYKVLYRFGATPTDAGQPDGGLYLDGAGNLYGASASGGDGYFRGAVYRIAPDGIESVLYSFKGVSAGDGQGPNSNLIADANGNLFGTTGNGGQGCSGAGCGTVFEVSPSGAETVLYKFGGGADGENPIGLVMDASGNLYGATERGAGTGCDGSGCGTIFRLAPDGTETVLYKFNGANDGQYPVSRLLLDEQGNLYGATAGQNQPGGTVFKLSPDGTLSTLHTFSGGADGAAPASGLTFGKHGELYGTTILGGGSGCGGAGCGTIYKINRDGTGEEVVHAFNGADGSDPESEVVLDKRGNLYGTTYSSGEHNWGVIYELTHDGSYNVLYNFCSRGECRDGANGIGRGGLVLDSHNHLFGTTEQGGHRDFAGVAFTIRK
ncbi:MAG TPA: choice-of-anchor tandem repeat GloVer-containing protein [Rhizomicrobium sp.]|jgi:uncharacterized repeat protein (TIGR03803 family)